MRYYFKTAQENHCWESTQEQVRALNAVFHFDNGDRQGKVYLRKNGDYFYLSYDQVQWSRLQLESSHGTYRFSTESYDFYPGFLPSGLANQDPGSLVAQMPGKVVKVLVNQAEKVTQGQTLLILEAMKMENEVKAPMDGQVTEITVKAGAVVEANHLLLSLD